MKRLFKSAYVVVMDDAGTEHEDGWVLVEDGVVAETGAGSEPEADEWVDLAGALVTPGLVNTHHHLYQTLTRARAQEADLFTWLKTLYPVWARLEEESEHAAAPVAATRPSSSSTQPSSCSVPASSITTT